MEMPQSIKEMLLREINAIDDPLLLQELLEIVEMEKKAYAAEPQEMNPDFEDELLSIYQRTKNGRYTDGSIDDETEEWLTP